MAFLNDPFEPVAGRPTFVQRLPVIQRASLTLISSVGLVAAAVVAVSLVLHATGPVGRGLYSCMFLLAVALGTSVKLMFLFTKPTELRNALVGFGALVATAALVSAMSLAEMLALAFVRQAFSDPFSGDAEKLTAIFAASFILLAVLGLVAAAARRTTTLPGPLPALTLTVAALPAVVLYTQSVTAIAVTALCSLLASAALIRSTSKK